MAYISITDPQIEIGEATKKELFQKIKDNQEGFNTDIEALKQTSTIDIFNFRLSGALNEYTAAQLTDRAPTFKAPVAATITSFVLTLLTVSTSGDFEVQLDKSTDNGINFTPLLTTPVEITGTTVGSISTTVDFVDIPSQSFAQNDLLRLRVVGVQVDQGEVQISIYGEVS